MQEVIAKSNNSLLEILDRLVDVGAVVDGELRLCVADIDLIELHLKAVLASSATLDHLPAERLEETFAPVAPSPHGESSKAESYARPVPPEGLDRREAPALPPPSPSPSPSRVRVDPDRAERGLVRLVLVIVELLRQLMERQAVRRMERGQLTERQAVRLGLAFERLFEKMEELKRFFGLSSEELNLDLGPLGRVI
jgi:hypothetical protein